MRSDSVGRSLQTDAWSTLVWTALSFAIASLALNLLLHFDADKADGYVWSALFGGCMAAGAVRAHLAGRRRIAVVLIAIAGLAAVGMHFLHVAMSPAPLDPVVQK